MKILLTGTEGSGIDRVERRLRTAGHETVSCSGGPDNPARCRGMVDPLDCPMTAGVDVIVAARERPLPHLTRSEQLLECALLSDVPLVVVGSTVMNPYGKRATALIEGYDDVAEMCERVARDDAPVAP